MKLTRLAVVLIVTLLAAACGGSEAANTENVASEDLATTTTTSAAPPTTTERDIAPETSVDSERLFPPPGLPIKQVFEFDQPLSNVLGKAGRIWAASYDLLIRLDPDTGDREEVAIPGPDDLRAVIFYLTESERHVIAAADMTNPGALDNVVSFDADTFERVATLRLPFGERMVPVKTRNSPEHLLGGDTEDRLFALDPSTMTLAEEPFLSTETGDITTLIGDDYWVWGVDGVVRLYDRSTYAERGSIDTGRSFALFSQSYAFIDGDSVWHSDHPRGILTRIDRADLSVTHEIDLSERYGDDVLVTIEGNGSDQDRPFVVLRATSASQVNYLILAEFDPANGEIVSEHTIADGSEESWGRFGMASGIAVVGDRVFVVDHPRRLIEVDVGRLDDTDLGPWVSPDLAWQPELTAEEDELAQKVIESANDPTVLPATDLEEEKLLRGTSGFGEREISAIRVDGDRAWGEVRIGDGKSWFVLSRIDGVWHWVTSGTCYFYFHFGNPCGY